jgi:predicted DNA repair protein MutK
VAKTLGVTVFDLDITPQYHSHVAAEADEPDSWVITVPG